MIINGLSCIFFFSIVGVMSCDLMIFNIKNRFVGRNVLLVSLNCISLIISNIM